MSRTDHAAVDAGTVTAELAACLPVLVLLLAFAVGVVGVGSARVRAQDAAREAARAAARGDPAAGERLAHEAAPGSTVTITHGRRRRDRDGASRAARRDVAWLPAVTVTGAGGRGGRADLRRGDPPACRP